MTSKVKDFLLTHKIDLEKEDIYSEALMEGGPKVAELSEDMIDCKRLIEALNINPELLAVEKERIQDVIVKNHWAFGLDDHLGHPDHAIQISLLPFHASPTNREVIDKQMDKWIQRGIIEPSTSP